MCSVRELRVHALIRGVADINVPVDALSNGEMFSLDMGSMTAATSSSLSWTDVGTPSFTTQGYSPVMALAENHIHFIDVPGSTAGQADIFVIHCEYRAVVIIICNFSDAPRSVSFFQPTPQAYPVSSGGNFPQQHGQTASFFQSQGVS